MRDDMDPKASADSADPEAADRPPLNKPRPITLKRALKNRLKRGMRTLFEVSQHFGLDVLPRHFYSEVPDVRALRRNGEWKLARTMLGVKGADLDSQFAFVERCCAEDRVRRLAQNDIHRDACKVNGEPGFGPTDAEFLYTFVSEMQPWKVVQVGCGVSTAVLLRAVAENTGYRPEIVCIEPYPTAFLRRADRDGSIQLVTERAQSVPLDVLTDLGSDGFLFVDSTHTVQPGSEVNRLVFEVLPRLQAGSLVHFHDVYFPYDYQRGLLDDELFFCNESALLHAFLINNQSFQILASMSMIHYHDSSRLRRSLPNYRPSANDHGLRASPGEFPASLYLEVV